MSNLARSLLILKHDMHERCFFESFGKIKILAILATEFAPDRESAAEIQLGENGFGSNSDAQKVENLDFLLFFESSHFQLHHSPNGKFRQKLANLLNFEFRALIRDFRKINNSHPGYAEI